jgi:hypothetical protein
MNSRIVKLIFLIFFLAVTVNIAQERSKRETIDKLADKLKQKILLNDNQLKEISLILADYKTTDEKQVKSLQKKIEGLLDPRQKAKYQIIKNDWWKEVNEVLK